MSFFEVKRLKDNRFFIVIYEKNGYFLLANRSEWLWITTQALRTKFSFWSIQ